MSVAFSRSIAARACLQAGFTLVELVIAALVVALVMSAVLASASLAQATYRVHAEAADMDQRTRVLVHALQHDLTLAGAGLDQGPLAGALTQSFAPILPRAIGTDGPEAATASAITVRYVPAGSPQTTILDDLAGGATAVRVATDGACPAADAVCGFSAGMQVAVFDGSGAYDLLVIADVQGGALRFRAPTEGSILPLAAGSAITAVVSRSYYLNESEARVYRYDGFQSRVPLVDNIVQLAFEYRGEPVPPIARRNASDPIGPWTTYGPRPPPVGVPSPMLDYGAGESCTFVVRDGQHAPRLDSWLGSLPAGSLVPIGIDRLGDGPWCPGRTTRAGVPAAGRFDADGLRIRSVRVTLRVQAGSPLVRGLNPAGRLLFSHPGTARSASSYLPDRVMSFEVTPANLNLDR